MSVKDVLRTCILKDFTSKLNLHCGHLSLFRAVTAELAKSVTSVGFAPHIHGKPLVNSCIRTSHISING